MILITEDKHIVLLLRKGKSRSKYFTLWCSCRRRRVDGSCKHQRDILEHRIKPEARHRVKLDVRSGQSVCNRLNPRKCGLPTPTRPIRASRKHYAWTDPDYAGEVDSADLIRIRLLDEYPRRAGHCSTVARRTS